MRFDHKTIRQGLDRLTSRVGVDGQFRDLGDDLPLRSELFSVSQLERHAEALAQWHQLDTNPGADRLLGRLAENERVLLGAYQVVTEAVDHKRPISPASEWLLDNFYVIEEQIRTTRRHLPKQYSRSLPRLANGPSAGYPRVYDLALELISHVDGRVDAESLRSFITAYQRNEFLNLGELWAIPIMLRQALIENLRRVAARIAKGTLDRNSASRWADQFIECADTAPSQLILAVADMARDDPQLSSAFVAEMSRRLSGLSPALAVPLTWIEQRLWEHAQTIDQCVQLEGQQQAVDQVSIGNSIISLRELDATDWRTFVESLSIVEQTLLGDPAGVYGDMDFETRDQYRHVIEKITQRSPLSEPAVAEQAIGLAQRSMGLEGECRRSAHVGFYLIDGGRSDLEHAARMRLSLAARVGRMARRIPLTLYLGFTLLLTIAVTVSVLWFSGINGPLAWLAGSLLFVGASHLSLGIIHWIITLLIPPQRLPRLDYSGGIPNEYRTLITVPTMLVNSHSVAQLLEGLEVCYFANRDDRLRFCLLTDFCDASQEYLPQDEMLLRQAQTGIKTLNAKYRDGSGDRFFLLHRPRRWNPREKAWMGQERKRGKLSDLNSLLRGGPQGAFSLIVGDTQQLEDVRYVITLDTDTLLPRDAARQLIGTLAHPLNQPRIDPQRNIVTEGYGILQPGVATSLETAGQSWFARLHGGEPGIDPYTRATSDVYQDLFLEGSFIGKGIYDVDAFATTTENRFLDNQILSHDLIEGCYARSGLVNDIQVYESYPTRYSSDVSRRHRWTRGDWQISGWTLPFVRGPDGRRHRNPLSMLSRWKIVDNLRRSIVPGVLLAVLLLGWLIFPLAPLWTIVVVAILLVPPVCISLVAAFRKGVDVPLGSHLREVAWSFGRSVLQSAWSIMLLPYEAFINLDAIVRTMVRMRLTHTGMLEWKTASDAEREGNRGLWEAYRRMAIAPGLAVLMGVTLAFVRPNALSVAAPLLASWLLAPAVAWRFSWPARARTAKLSRQQSLFLHQLSRKTWRFFERFIGPEDHWLPPDNVQELPVAVIAHRTSPTNIGLSLLSTLTAYDFGYISAGRLIERTGYTLHTLGQLERFRGHLLNWYDTRTLQPLPPSYVSSVDSGNLVGHLLTLRAGLMELPDRPLVPPQLRDSLSIMQQILESVVGDTKQTPQPSVRHLAATRELIKLLMQRGPFSATDSRLSESKRLLQTLHTSLLELAINPPAKEEPELFPWLRDLQQQCQDYLLELRCLAPWLTLPPAPLEPPHSDRHDGDRSLTELRSLLDHLERVATLRDVADLDRQLPLLDKLVSEHPPGEAELRSDLRSWLLELRAVLCQASQHGRQRLRSLEHWIEQCGELATIDYGFLYDPSRRLLAIGYNVSERRRDPSFYDLLASESRLASFVGIAQGRLEQEHWFSLGRLLTTSKGKPALLSWSGSMFEYLMPLLVMPTYQNSLLHQTYEAVVDRHIEYGRQRGTPWGISESGYNLTDVQLNYQYRAFGVPGLGFKRGLVDDLVIAPYASAMALMVTPELACANLQRLSAEGFSGDFGFYEAIDYTRSRVARGQTHSVVRSYMAHHQGMSLLSLAYLLLDKPMQRRFRSDPQLQATELLLQERIPNVAPFYPHAAEVIGDRQGADEPAALIRVFDTPDTPVPEVHLLSNGNYHVMITNAGGGYSSWRGLAATRWREDATRDSAGLYCFVRDVENGKVWSTTFQPSKRPADEYEAIFSQARAEFRRRDGDISIHTEIAVSPEDDIEIRRSTITNHSKATRTLELTSYAEVVIAAAAADNAHPAFSNLFVQTEVLGSRQAIVCTRRPRSQDEQPPWMLHLFALGDATSGGASYETDRLKFIGRGRTLSASQAMAQRGPLSNTAGSVLDPIVSIRVELTLLPDETVCLDLVNGMADTRDHAVELIDKYRDRHLADRVFEMAWTHGQVVLRQLNASETDAQLFGRLASSVLYTNPTLRAHPAMLARNQRGQSGLWGHGISGDLPIVLLRICNADKIDLVRQLVQAHAFWRRKGLAVDLVIWNEGPEGYRQVLQDLIVGLVSAGTEAHALDHPGGIFVRRADQMGDEDRILLQTVARAVIVDTQGTLAEQLDRRMVSDPKTPALVPRRRQPESTPNETTPPRDLVFANGVGGFTADGREYVIRMEFGQVTPAPWVNVLANPTFGTVVSESGGAYTWTENAHEFRLTPWYNDPVTDESGEAFYLRDEESGHFWSPMPQPAQGKTPYVCRHGFGYSVFEHTENGVSSECWIYVPTDGSVKYTVLKLGNRSGRSRRLSATAYCEWVLGDLRAKGLMHVVTEVDPQSGSLLARNPYNMDFPEHIAFLDVNDTARTVTGDRTEFLGRNGDPHKPAAMNRVRLSGKVGAGLDPCGAVQTSFDLADGQEREIVFVLGVGRNIEDVRRLVGQHRGVEAARGALSEVWDTWNRTLGTVQVETPSATFNIMANGWLLYQTLACRYWARSGYYQSGGAFGFRDQLQDVAALVYSAPHLIREHLLRCAGRQFVEGDVQHWWHPPMGRGVRTHFSDDLLWLPLITCRYVRMTGDTGVLDEIVPFLEGRELQATEEAYYDLPLVSTESGTLYEHCLRAIMKSLSFGVHGLPLIGCGDWNDGMNLVGQEGRGESVWLAFFLYENLQEFSTLARIRGDHQVADRCDREAAQLRENIERNGWDGGWYRRAYFDNGEPLGSADNAECQIDSIAQSWSVLSRAGDPQRSRQAMDAVDERLVRRDSSLIQLFDPPFDQSDQEPGYIKGYVPGVRENGGQYTHAAIWTVMAFAELGDHERAWELFAMINPIHHGSTPTQIATYKVEPYVVAADVYAVSPHTGRGGWTWYTGSASWMYRLMIESLLGLRLEVDRLRFVPCLPADWKSFTLHYRYRETQYHIQVLQPESGRTVKRVLVDGEEQPDKLIHLRDDRQDHYVEIEVGIGDTDSQIGL